MEIETYEIEDASNEASAMANDATAMELIEKLGLKGQESLLNKGTVTRLPYRVMEAQEMLVYKALCDKATALEEYAAESIPTRVLQVAAHAKECEMFHSLQVWYPSIAKIDDPILIGVKKEYPCANHADKSYHHLSNDHFYILARWGKTLLPFEKLHDIAVKMLKTRRESELAKALAEIKTAISSLSDTNDLAILSKGVSISC